MKRRMIFAVTILMSLLLTTVVFAADPTPTPKAEVQNAADKKTEEKIDINSATLEELMKLPGIGEVIGQRIIDARPYEKPEDLIGKVKGIGEKTFEKIKALIVATPIKKDDDKKDEKPTPTPKPKK